MHWIKASAIQYAENVCDRPFSDRVFLALVERQEDRGMVVAQGGGKVSIVVGVLF